jgi:hypothetical protein
MNLSIKEIRRILLLLACLLMAPHSQSRGRKRRRGRKEEEEEKGVYGRGGLDAHELQHDGTHRQRNNAQEPGAPFLFFPQFKFCLLFV